ncbi:ComF family protein [Candidatus Gottesmanbacteria bacterium]|nr:ComF family protein [Candidatus Gottesmanbacteria bacterium]
MIDGVFALTYYKGAMKRAIRLLKYHSVTDLVTELSSLLVSLYPSFLPKFDYFVPVPLSRKRERLRGYNQAELLARAIGTRFSVPIETTILSRVQYLKPQVDLRGDERRKNIIGSFSYNSSFTISNKNVCLVDDVSTTGATLMECGKVLKANGAGKVWAIVLAHGS